MHYSGDLKPVILASGTAITSSSEVTTPTVVEIDIGRLLKPIFYVKVVTGTTSTGSMTVTYACRAAELPSVADVEAVIPLTAVGDMYYGYWPFTSDYSTVRIVKVKNSMNTTLTSYEVGITGKIIY
jgi:hypothetical protein